MKTAVPYRYTPLPKLWPGKKRPTSYRRPAGPFKVTTWRPIELLLTRELARIGARDVVIAVDMPHPHSWNTQGTPRADARAASPAVIVSFTRRDGARLTFPCDTYNNWQTNVYAIAKSLELLRAIDRYEVMPEGRDQYTGAQLQLPGATAAMTAEQAADILAKHSLLPAHVILQEPAVALVAIRTAMRATHPDTGGDQKEFTAVSNAADVVNALHEVTS